MVLYSTIKLEILLALKKMLMDLISKFIEILYYFSDSGNTFYILKIIMMMYLVEKKSLLPE